MEEYMFPFTMFAIVGLLFLLFWWFNKDNRLKRELKKAKGIRISDFKEGAYAKIVGKSMSTGETLIAPLSGRECVYYQITVEVERGDDDGFSWEKLFTENKAIDFLVSQSGETAYIEAKNVTGFLVKDAKERSGVFNGATGKMKALLQRHGEKSKGFLGINKSLRYKEGIVEVGEAIAVMGKGNWTRAENNSKTPILTLSGNHEQPLKISDHSSTLTEAGIPQPDLFVEKIDKTTEKQAQLPEPKKPVLSLDKPPSAKSKKLEKRYRK